MRKLLTLTLSIGVLLGVVAGSAQAAVENSCTITLVNWTDDGTTRTLYIGCADGTVHAAYQSGNTGTGCSARSVDTLKIWQSVGQAGKLSGKSATIWYNNATCGGFATRIITAVQLDGS
jgi:hypothetical protein